MDFMGMLQSRFDEGRFVCVGLDTDLDKLPVHLRQAGLNVVQQMAHFNREIVQATADLVCAYKPNAAFYERYGLQGYAALHELIIDVHRLAPGVPVILDAKRGDIGNTNLGYVASAFDELAADAITINPYMGAEAMAPFLQQAGKGIIVLVRTSNPGAGEFQDLPVDISHEEAEELGLCGHPDDGEGMTWATSVPFYLKVAQKIAIEWNRNGNCAVVVGATRPDELRQVRRVVGDMPILIPGIGAQGGDLEATVKAGANSKGQGMIINSSRAILYASGDKDFAEAARRATQELHDAITRVLAVGAGV